ncbi:MAG: regulatory iron-sulfur-containing complex subunit RicT [candidate division SR1 bacterium]|nr:regulatory iron-sulfur-containing complex subunit RicT [candidate division SR1 bacterium]
MAKNAYVLDRYTNKNVLVKNVDDEQFAKLKSGDKIVYSSTDQTGVSKQTVGTYIGHEIVTDRQGNFQKILEGEDKEFFEEQQKLALDIFPLFKKLFKKNFHDSIPVTARYQIFGDQLYFYFYSEERYVFTDFVKEFRQEIGKNIFLFQIGARDMIKMSPGADNLPCGADGILPMHCKTSLLLPSVEMENLVIQNLEGRDIEKLKGRCGKLKCSLIYELETYVEESKKFPPKGSYVENVGSEVCGTVFSFNIMNGDVTVKTKDGGMIVRIPYTTIKKVKLANSKPEESTKDVTKPSEKSEVAKTTPPKK